MKKSMAKSQWMLPSLVNTKLKQAQLVNQLNDNRFFAWAVGQWRSRSVARGLLKFTYPPQQQWKAATIPAKELHGRLYLFATEAQYRDQVTEARTMALWKKDAAKYNKPEVWVPDRNRCPCLRRRKWALVRSYLAWTSGPPMLHGVWDRVVG